VNLTLFKNSTTGQQRVGCESLYSENLDSASAQSAGLSASAVGSSSLDATRGFKELSGLSIDDFWREASCESVDLQRDEFAGALLAVGNRYNFGLPAGLNAGPAQIGNFLRALQLQDLALAQACALGRDAAWREFMARYREPLTRAATAMTGSATAGEELADSLWPEMFGLSERGGQRVSPLAGYSGRGSLAGFLRATLAQRNVDRHRRTYRETELPAREFPAAAAAVVPEAGAVAQLCAALKETLGTLNAEERFLLSAWFLDERTLLEISRIIRVHEATVSRRIQKLTARLREEVLGSLQSNGMSRVAAEEAVGVDPRDIDINLRGLLQASRSEACFGKGALSREET
jgi:RNA polymerase sigma-70 factor (ECF subfamily)